jgi:site-specific recombinase XerD
VHKLLRGIRREKGTAPRRKAALLTDHLRRLRRETDGSMRELRDRAVILVGFAGAFRRSELAALDLTDCEFGERMVTITLRKSKTDQESRGRAVVIHSGGALCPIEALRSWLEAAAITEGPVFRSVRSSGRVGKRLTAESVCHIVKDYAGQAGLDARDFAGHSLRAGHVTQAILRGESAHAIMMVTGHQSRAMVDRYFRDVEPRRHNSSANLGL